MYNLEKLYKNKIIIIIFNQGLTSTALLRSISIEASNTVLAAEAFRVEQTLETFASVGVTAGRNVGVNVVVAHTRFTCTAFSKRVAKVVVDATVTLWCCNSLNM